FVELAVAGSALRRGAPQANGDHGTGPPPPAPPVGGYDAPAERVQIAIQVASALPVEVSLDLRPEAVGCPLVVHALPALHPRAGPTRPAAPARAPRARPPPCEPRTDIPPASTAASSSTSGRAGRSAR